MSDLAQLTEAVKTGKKDEAIEQTQAAIAASVPPEQVLNAMVKAMDGIGKDFQEGRAFVPEMLIAARAMKESLAVLEPELVAAGIKPEFKVVIGTVQGDLHDIGKNLVAMMWRGSNFEVVDLGTNVTAEQFIAAIQEHGPQIVGLSALLTTTMTAMKNIVEAIKAADLAGVKIMVGGAPITQEFADRVGADGYAADAASAVEIARQLLAA